MSHRRAVLSAAVLVTASAGLLAQSGGDAKLSRADAARCEQKLARITELGEVPRTRSHAARQTVLREGELNAYLRFILQPQLPSGVLEPAVQLMGGGQFGVRTVFDLDVVRAQRERGMTDPLRYVSGRVPLTMECVLRTQNGQGTLELLAATMSGLSVPKFVVQELVVYATRTPDNPQGFRFDEPFLLPATIREILLSRGEAVVIQ
jgi:hypothetical protein